jgi:hypothetical protein
MEGVGVSMIFLRQLSKLFGKRLCVSKKFPLAMLLCAVVFALAPLSAASAGEVNFRFSVSTGVAAQLNIWGASKDIKPKDTPITFILSIHKGKYASGDLVSLNGDDKLIEYDKFSETMTGTLMPTDKDTDDRCVSFDVEPGVYSFQLAYKTKDNLEPVLTAKGPFIVSDDQEPQEFYLANFKLWGVRSESDPDKPGFEFAAYDCQNDRMTPLHANLSKEVSKNKFDKLAYVSTDRIIPIAVKIVRHNTD